MHVLAIMAAVLGGAYVLNESFKGLWEMGVFNSLGLESPRSMDMEVLQKQISAQKGFAEAQQIASDEYLKYLTKHDKEASEQLKQEREDQRAYEQQNMKQQFMMTMMAQKAASEPSVTQAIGAAAQLASQPVAPEMPTGGGNLDVFMPEFPVAALLQ